MPANFVASPRQVTEDDSEPGELSREVIFNSGSGGGEGGNTAVAGLGLAGKSSSSTLLCVNKSPFLINLAPALTAYTVQIFLPEMEISFSTLPIYY